MLSKISLELLIGKKYMIILWTIQLVSNNGLCQRLEDLYDKQMDSRMTSFTMLIQKFIGTEELAPWVLANDLNTKLKIRFPGLSNTRFKAFSKKMLKTSTVKSLLECPGITVQ